jgi:isoleucyl-tRNA synthetase
MDLVKDIVNEGRVARNNAKIKNRQPIKSLFIKSNKNLRDDCVNIIKDELNIKEIIMVDDIDSFTEYSVKPQLKVLGPKYGKMLSDISQHLQHIDSKELIKSIQDIGSIKVKVRDSEIILTEEDLLIKAVSKNNYIVQEGNGITVILDINLDKGLIDEGLARELISKIQTMRKEAGFDVMDKIIVSYVTDDDIIDNVLNNMSYISKEVLADAIYKSNLDGYIKEWDINGYKVILSVKKID